MRRLNPHSCSILAICTAAYSHSVMPNSNVMTPHSWCSDSKVSSYGEFIRIMHRPKDKNHAYEIAIVKTSKATRNTEHCNEQDDYFLAM